MAPLRGAAPARMTTFFGRDRERRQINALLREQRLVTVLGPGGIGKTRLVAEVSADPTDLAPVWWCGLAPLTEPDAVARALLSTVRCEADPGRDPVACLADAIGSRRALLVIDNCEHLVAAVAEVVEHLLLACPQLRILTTSREVLGVPGEHVVRLQGLPCDDGGPAAALFVDRARAAGGPAPVTPDDHAAVARICNRLDGVPLALEIVASRTRTMSLIELADLLDRRFALLDAGGPRGDERHRTLRATLDWSHELLDDAQQRLFRRLGAFRCGGTLQLVEEICADDSLPRERISDLLVELVDRSMVIPVTRGDRTRFTLLEPLAAYARERLVEAGEDRTFRDRHAEAYARRCDELRDVLRVRWDAATIREIADDDFSDLRAALAWCDQHDATPDRAFRIAAALWHVPLVAHAEDIRLAALGVLTRWPSEPHPLRVDVLGVAAIASLVVGDWEGAADLCRQALDLEAQTGHPALVARRAWLYYFVGHPPQGTAPVPAAAPDGSEAADRARELAQLAQEAGWTALACEARALEARSLAEIGSERAVELAREALEEAERLGGDRLIGRVSYHLGRTLPDGEQARPHLERAREHGRRTGDPDIEGHALQELAEFALQRGDTAGGAALYRDALAVFSDAANAPHEWEVLQAVVPLLESAGEGALAAEVDAAAGRFGREAFRLLQANDPATLSAGRPGITESERATLERLVPPVLEALDTLVWGSAEPSAPSVAAPGLTPEAVFRRKGELWELAFAGQTISLPDLKGLHDLAVLLARPGVEVHALQLVSPVKVPAAVGAGEGLDGVEGDLGPLLDDAAREAYRAKISALREDIAEAEAIHDLARAEQGREELEALTASLTAAYGLGGRSRRAGDPAERARTTVTSRIRSTITRIEGLHPALGAHLRHAVRTGTYCCYDPETPVAWQLD